ncbi:MAG: dockerin type I repeat-containing protein, partial [Oscillospiraceae bacterium]|nr:dockerin type I repeat-containing protein [Oscillospiraceae bacterium]
MSDSDEINLNLDPLHADSANDGTNDSYRKFQQSVTYTETDDTLPVSEVEVSFNGTGYINSTTTIKKDDSNRFAAELVGIIGSPFSFESSSDFDSASISFTLDSADISNVQDVGIVWFDEKFQRFRNVDCVYDAANSTVSANVPHFSTYCVVDKSEMLNSQSDYYFTSNSNSDDNDNDGIPDCYESTNSENPENEYVLSNGKTTFSLINEPHSDKQTSRDTIYDVVTIEENGQIYYTDGIVDGEEIVFSIGGDANCDGIINSDDTLLLQNYLSGNAELTDDGTVNSDCDLDGEITFSDIAQINYYIDNGSNNAPNNLDMGDLNNDGAVNSIDLALLMNALLGVSSLNPAYVSRADFTGDGKIDVNDYILMKNYLINNSTSIVGLNYFYYNSDPMKNDTDGDKDWDQADPEPTVHQLNGYFAR